MDKLLTRPPEEQMDWVEDLYDIIEVTRNRVRVLELKIKKLERKVRQEVDFEDDDDEE